MTPEWVQQIIRVLNTMLPKSFIGKLEVNCVNGRVGNLIVNQSFKDADNFEKFCRWNKEENSK